MKTITSDQETPVIHRRELIRRGARRRHPGWVRVVMVLVVLMLLHTPLFLSLMSEREEPAPASSGQCELFALPRPEALNAADGTKGVGPFLKWIFLTEPSQWYYPTAGGFSQFNRRKALPMPELPVYLLKPAPLPERVFPESPMAARPTPFNDQEFLQPGIFFPEPLPDDSPVPVLLPRWRRAGGGELQNPPVFTESELALLRSPEVLGRLPSDCRPTRLALQFRPGVVLPRILLRESCGVKELDQAALRALRSALQELGANDLVPLRFTEYLLEVDWRL